MAKKEEPKSELLTLYDKLVMQCPRFERKGKNNPYTSANGYMFSMINKDGDLGMRFSKEVQESYFEKYTTTIFKNYNSIILGYILITEDMLKDEKLLVDLLNESFDHVMSLKSK